MKALAVAIATLAVVSSLPALAAEQPLLQNYITGAEFLALTHHEQVLYVTGAFNSLHVSAMPTSVALICTQGMTRERLTAVLEKWLKDHPESATANAAGEILSALVDVCPVAAAVARQKKLIP